MNNFNNFIVMCVNLVSLSMCLARTPPHNTLMNPCRLMSRNVRRNEFLEACEHLNAMTNEYFRRAGTQPRMDFDRSG